MQKSTTDTPTHNMQEEISLALMRARGAAATATATATIMAAQQISSLCVGVPRRIISYHIIRSLYNKCQLSKYPAML
jgi:hypothetical protein